MKMPKHTGRFSQILARLTGWARGSAAYRRFRRGVGVFESNLETTLWALRGEEVAGVRPVCNCRSRCVIKMSFGQWASIGMDHPARVIWGYVERSV
jgi:hypothetical protein